ncbi:putative oxidoreductase [Zhongshania aliphaticivorans]|uniref:Putative oxidoreductase n=1 Tax=Zhongshania aliphaticivorans TaxID=1470434 RepID=A0A5S9N7S9_9GAMM|nr:SDR family NAD(P)-dependent oxidoreductase [Zhongshania aliphaticivorans]CAA0079771.1 putative oxidoreductase [Zhongshania aliphaticivorans]CAA0086033.1 putative oxidoreductase [Zhongshania aliphaticivorans]
MSAQSRTEIALITGASAGIGRAFAIQLAPRCKTMILIGRDPAKLASVVSELEQPGLNIVSFALDLTTTEGVTRVMEAIRQKGPVSMLINNAGFASYGKFAESDLDAEMAMVNLHCNASLALCRAALPYMKQEGRGEIVNVSSMAGFFPVKHSAVYAASKTFLTMFSQALQQEVQGDGIRVQCLCPSYTRTDFSDRPALADLDATKVPDELWWTAEDIVAVSLAQLEDENGPVICLPDKMNREMVHGALTAQASAFA